MLQVCRVEYVEGKNITDNTKEALLKSVYNRSAWERTETEPAGCRKPHTGPMFPGTYVPRFAVNDSSTPPRLNCLSLQIVMIIVIFCSGSY